MKTADLIPFILLELNECDKYGFELTKNIETKSQGKILIKQPTLYTLLKKLEKSKFISSYWQDSEIGGKRHYYKLTENGRLQVSTLPSFNFLLKNALEEAEDTGDEITPQKPSTTIQETSILENTPTPVETIIPTEEVFNEHSLDNSTEYEINNSNTEILKNVEEIQGEEFASSEDVIKFTEKHTTNIDKEIENKPFTTQNNDIFSNNYTVPNNEMEIKFVNYVDFKNSDNYKKANTIAKKKLLQALFTSGSIITMILICSLITHFTSRSGIFYCYVIAGIMVTIFYPLTYLVFFDKIRFKYESIAYNPKAKLKLYIGLCVLLFVLIISIIFSISVGYNTISKLLGWRNFKNLYAPILITAVYFLDLLYNKILFSKLEK